MSHPGPDPAESDHTQTGAPGPTVLREVEVRRPVLGLSPAQVAGSALAAVSAAFFASWLGVAGTLVGAALGSIVGTVGSATYTYSLQRGHAVVRSVRPLGLSAAATAAVEAQEAEAAAARSWRRWPWKRIAVGGAVVLAATFATLTVIEGIAGRPVSSITTGDDSGGTTIGHVVDGNGGDGSETPATPTDDPTPTESPSPSPSDQPSPTPSDSPSPTDQPTPSGSPSSDPSQSPTPGAAAGEPSPAAAPTL
jgi:hypothetical protein